MSKELQVAMDAAKAAGDVLLQKFFGKRSLKSKTQFDFVTDADKEAEAIILEKIRSNFPEHSILSEEAGTTESGSEYMWIVDPLDGTTNYTVHNPFFNASVALARKKEVILGEVYSPFTKELYHAEKGRGAYLNGKRIHVSGESEISKSLLVYCHASTRGSIRRIMKAFEKIKPLARDFSRMRSGSLELALVASGRLGAYIAPDGYVWDSAAGSLLVREAGGKVTDFEGNTWDTGKKNSDIVASNGALHGKILDLLKGL